MKYYLRTGMKGLIQFRVKNIRSDAAKNCFILSMKYIL